MISRLRSAGLSTLALVAAFGVSFRPLLLPGSPVGLRVELLVVTVTAFSAGTLGGLALIEEDGDPPWLRWAAVIVIGVIAGLILFTFATLLRAGA